MFGIGKKAVPKPKEKGVANVPVVMQLEALECGAASLTMIMHYYRKFIPLEQARVDTGVSQDGVNARNLMTAARSYGMQCNAWRLEPEALLEEGPFPCIIHWGFNHYVVLCGFKGKRAVLNDPARGRVTVEWEEFDREFTGICLAFEPGEAVRMLPYLREGGQVVVSSRPVMPVTATLGGASYDAGEMLRFLEEHTEHLMVVDAEAALKDVGSPKVLNLILLGAALKSGALGLTEEEIRTAILQKIPERFHELNFRALAWAGGHL